jgi:hypothetical protein
MSGLLRGYGCLFQELLAAAVEFEETWRQTRALDFGEGPQG